jgi:hypothetical protein
MTGQPWPQIGTGLEALGMAWTPEGVARFHHYVSADPDVHPLGSVAPQGPQVPVLLDLAAVERASEMVSRVASGSFRKKGRRRATLLKILTGPMGLSSPKVARHFGVHHSACRQNIRFSKKHDRWIQALMVTLNDGRAMSAKS